MWTLFWDMRSGGRLKEKQHYIFIEAPEDEAVRVFFARFGHNPRRVTCTCCGEDYALDSHEDLAQLTGFHRNCRPLETPWNPRTSRLQNDDPVIVGSLYLEEDEEPPDGYKVSTRLPLFGNYQTVEQFEERDDVLFIRAGEIKPGERETEVPRQGYVWVD